MLFESDDREGFIITVLYEDDPSSLLSCIKKNNKK